MHKGDKLLIKPTAGTRPALPCSHGQIIPILVGFSLIARAP